MTALLRCEILILRYAGFPGCLGYLDRLPALVQKRARSNSKDSSGRLQPKFLRVTEYSVLLGVYVYTLKSSPEALGTLSLSHTKGTLTTNAKHKNYCHPTTSH